MPNAAVDLPFISPVWTASSGRLRRCRVVRPSCGVTATCPCGTSPPRWRSSAECLGALCSPVSPHALSLGGLPQRAHRGGQRLGGQLLQAQGLRAQRRPERAGQPESHRAGLAVDDDGGRPRRRQQRRGRVRVGRSEEHTSELQSRQYLVCRLLLEKKKQNQNSSLLPSTY